MIQPPQQYARERVRTMDDVVDAMGMHSLDALPGVAQRLPVALTSFVGREAERAALTVRVSDPTSLLVTITGAGGVGKTRLALEIARALDPERVPETPFVHGVFVVPLAALTAREAQDGALVTTIASALGLRLSGPDPALTQVQSYLTTKAMLLVLDNFEHLMSSAPLLTTLLQAVPTLTLLVTARERLHIQGEWVIDLDGLPYPSDAVPPLVAEYGAVQLFVQRARAAVQDFALTPENTPHVVRICQLVGGLPLGIELAASWVSVLSCAEIAAEIAQGHDLLDSHTPNVPTRQRSMRAVFASSWSLLSPEEQQALRRLTVFQGSFTRAAAFAVAATSLPLLAALVHKSLLRRSVGAGGAETRYALPEPLRQLAAEELAAANESQELARRHAHYYLDLLAGRTADLRGPRQPTALADLSAEITQIRAAWHWAAEQRDSAQLGQAADALFHLFDMRSWFSEGAALFGAARKALAASVREDAARLVWGKLLAREGWLVFHTGRQREAQALLEQSLAILRARDAQADLVWTLNYLAAICSYLGEYATTDTLCHESLRLTEIGADVYGRVIALSVLCQTAYECGDFHAARVYGEQSLALEEQIGSRWSIAFSLMNLAKVMTAQGDYAVARHMFDETFSIRQSLGDVRGMAICLNRLGDLSRAERNHVAAVQHYTDSLRLFSEIGNQWGTAATLINLGRLALDHRADGAAARLLHDGLALALDTSSVPQITAIIAALGELAHGDNEAMWVAALVARTASDPHRLDRYQVDVARLLHWAAQRATAESLLTRDAAIAATATAARTPVQAADATPPASPKPTYPAGLTVREVEVLRLVAQGLTDAQVADQLVLSRRTVQAHLASIYGKLDVNTRSAATRFAVEHGLS